MLKLIIFTIAIISIRSVFNLSSLDLCYSNGDSECKGNYSYYCTADICSLNMEKCNKYKIHRKSYIFRDFYPLIKFYKEIKRCNLNETIDLNKYCLNRHDCLHSKKLIINEITIKNEIKQIDCKCPDDFKYECNRNYCTNDLDSCKMVQSLERNKIKTCGNKITTVIQKKFKHKIKNNINKMKNNTVYQ
jgi:hypothetical protein